jgi:hypothetical protein
MHHKLDDHALNSNEIGSLAKKIKSTNITLNPSKLNNHETMVLNTKQSTNTFEINVDKFSQNEILKLTMLSKLPAQVH